MVISVSDSIKNAINSCHRWLKASAIMKFSEYFDMIIV